MILVLDGSSGGNTLVVLASPEGDVVSSALASGTGELATRCAGIVDGRAVSAVAAVCGPGTYTGTRIAIAAATGFASATGIPVFGLSSLDVAVACLGLISKGTGEGHPGDGGGARVVPGVLQDTGAAQGKSDQAGLAVREAGRDRFFVVVVPVYDGQAGEPGRLHLLSREVLSQWTGPVAGDFGATGWHGLQAESLALRAAQVYSDDGFLRPAVVQQFGPTALTPSLVDLLGPVHGEVGTGAGAQEAGVGGSTGSSPAGGEL